MARILSSIALARPGLRASYFFRMLIMIEVALAWDAGSRVANSSSVNVAASHAAIAAFSFPSFGSFQGGASGWSCW